MGLPLDAQMQWKRLGVVVRIVAVPCSCMVVYHVNPSCAVCLCATDAAPPRYPTRPGKKHRASRLLGPQGAIGAGVDGGGGWQMA